MARYARKIAAQAMDDQRLKSIVQSEIFSATGSLLGSDGGGDLADRRRQSMEYYLSEPFGNEIDGRSQVIDSVVHDVVEAALPPLLEPFTASDEIVRFEAQEPEDEEAAKQATDYINYIFAKDNEGFRILHWWFKDALLQKNGIVKVFWEETDAQKRETFTGLSEDEVALILDSEGVEPIEHDIDPQTGAHNLTILREYKKGRVRIMNVPPEEFLIARRAVTMERSPFMAHRVRKSISELIEEGYDPEILERIPSYDEAEYNEERLARFEADDEWPVDANSLDPAMRHVWLYECYMMVDYDGDGVAELRKITVAGPGYDLLDNEPIDDQPFIDITPIPMPHKFFGMSMADETMDLQLISSTILRQLLDQMYGANNQRVAINERVQLDDLLTKRPEGVVRVKGEGPIGDSISVLQNGELGQFAYPLLEHVNTLREERTGVTRYTQGLDADSLNKTARGMNMIMQKSDKRLNLMVRIFAETGVKVLMRKILHLVVNHQDKERVIRLRNEWIPMDPRSWNTDMDVSISVGLGFGTQESKMLAMQGLAQFHEKVIMLQGGAQGPLVTWQEIFNLGAKVLEASQEKNIEQFIKNPEDMREGEMEQMTQRPPDPKAIEAQMKAQEAQGKQQLEGAKLQQDDRHHGDDMQFRYTELEAQTGLDTGKLQLEGEKIGLEGQKVQQDGEIKREQAKASGKPSTVVQLDSEGAVEMVAEAVEKMAVDQSEALTTAVEQMAQASAAIAQAMEMMNAPKRIIKDKQGRPVGIEPGVPEGSTIQ